MRNYHIKHHSDQTNFVLGGILITLGAIFLLGQLFGIRFGHYVWPFYIIVPGVLLFILALSTEDEGGRILAGIGSIVTMTGLLLFYQNMTNHFESWAYGWALVSLVAVGLGRMLYGTLKDRPKLVRAGERLATVGLTIFFAGAVFFELIIGISGYGIGSLGRFALPILLISAGAFFLFRSMWSDPTGERPRMPAEPAGLMVELDDPTKVMDSGDIAEEKVEQEKVEEMEDVLFV